jgi:conjugal transfer mating pair stabilization protein TraN
MRKWSLLLVLLPGTFPVHGKDPLLEKAKEEARDFGDSQGDWLRSSLQKELLSFSKDDLLPLEDRGKTFDPDMASTEQDMNTWLKYAGKGERMEGTEEFFTGSRHVIADPNAQLEILSEEARSSIDHEKFETCQEAGIYQLVLTQRRVVEVIPAIKEKIRYCRGHEEHQKFHLESNAKDHRKKQEHLLERDSTLKSSNVEISRGGLFHMYLVTSTWKHKDGVHCDHSSLKEKVVRKASEKDSWETDDPEVLSALSSHPNCRMLYSQVTAGPETQSIQGSSIFRDCWEKRLFFSCGDKEDSKCARLRESGAQIYEKKCLKQSPLNEHECDLWEKVYRVSGERIHNSTVSVFQGEAIWGLEGSFDSSYEANTDFGSAVTTLSVLSDLKQNIEETGTDFSNGKGEVFRGQAKKCQRSFVEGAFFDCCQKMKGVAVASKLCHCSSEEKDLAVLREEGKCHYIGTYTKMLGTEKIQSFCCFPTKLARVIQEQGREQLKLHWGSAEHPDCSGFTVQQLRNIDCGKLDLNEVVRDLTVDKDFVQRKIQQVSRDLQTEQSKDRMKQRSEETLQKRPPHA